MCGIIVLIPAAKLNKVRAASAVDAVADGRRHPEQVAGASGSGKQAAPNSSPLLLGGISFGSSGGTDSCVVCEPVNIASQLHV